MLAVIKTEKLDLSENDETEMNNINRRAEKSKASILKVVTNLKNNNKQNKSSPTKSIINYNKNNIVELNLILFSFPDKNQINVKYIDLASQWCF